MTVKPKERPVADEPPGSSAPGWNTRVRDARMHVSEVAVRLFRERGFDETTVDDVAHAAGIVPRTFFRYFPTKVDAVFPDHEERLARLMQIADHLPRPITIPLLIELGRPLVAEVLADPAFFIPRYQLVATVPALRAHAEMQMLDYKRFGIRLLGEDLGPGFLGTALATLVYGALIDTLQACLYEWAARDGDLDVLAILDATLPSLVHLPIPEAAAPPAHETGLDHAEVVVDSFGPKAIGQLIQLVRGTPALNR